MGTWYKSIDLFPLDKKSPLVASYYLQTDDFVHFRQVAILANPLP